MWYKYTPIKISHINPEEKVPLERSRRYCCRPVTLSPGGSNIGALYQKLYIQSKSAPEDGRVCHPKRVELI